MRRVTILLSLALVLVAVAVAVGLGWRVASGMLVPVPYGVQPEFEIRGYDPARGVVILPAPPSAPRQFQRTDAEGRFGLLWSTGGGIGHGRLGGVVAHGDGWLERPLEVVAGPPPATGAPARLDVTLHRRDPLADHGVPFEEVRIEGPAGAIAGWWIDRGGDAAVVMVHGRRRGDRTETLRALPTVLASGASVLVTSYRNHDRSDPAPHGLYTYGRDEADDLLAALAFLRVHGVERVAVVSYSMGSAVALLARERWPEAGPRLAGIAMDSPLLDPREVVTLAVERAGMPLPRLVAGVGLALARLRVGVDWRALDLRRLAPTLDVPTLLIGGVADQTIPVALLDDFAAAAPPEWLTYWRVEGADHVEAHNVDPDGYEQRLAAVLAAADLR
jgi:uncharacterized protein